VKKKSDDEYVMNNAPPADWPFNIFTQQQFDPRYVIENSSGQKYDARQLATYANNLRFGPVNELGRVAPRWPLLGTPMSDDDILRVENRAMQLGWRSAHPFEMARFRVRKTRGVLRRMLTIVRSMSHDAHNHYWLLRRDASNLGAGPSSLADPLAPVPLVRELYRLDEKLVHVLLRNLREIAVSAGRSSYVGGTPSDDATYFISKFARAIKLATQRRSSLDECLLLAIGLGHVGAVRELLRTGADSSGSDRALLLACGYPIFTFPPISYGTSIFNSNFDDLFTWGWNTWREHDHMIDARVREHTAHRRWELIDALKVDASAPRTNAIEFLIKILTYFPSGSKWDEKSARILITRSARDRAGFRDAFLRALQGSVIVKADWAAMANVFRSIMLDLLNAGRMSVRDIGHDRALDTVFRPGYGTGSDVMIHHVKFLLDLGVDATAALARFVRWNGDRPQLYPVAVFLLDMGAQLKEPQARSPVFGEALHQAIKNKEYARARMLVRSGVPLSAEWANYFLNQEHKVRTVLGLTRRASKRPRLH
jgi:hypothetical protein